MKRKILSILLSLTLLTALFIPSFSASAAQAPYNLNGYYYSNLTSNGQEAYRRICDAIVDTKSKDFPDTIQVPTITKSELYNIAQAVCWDNPEFFNLNYYNTYLQEANGKGTTVVPDWTYSKTDYQKELAIMRSKADQYLKNAPKNGSDYDKELYVHDKIIEIGTYPDSDTQYSDSSNLEGDYYYQTAISMLKDGKGVCESYSLAAEYLLNKLGVKCYPVGGFGSNDGGQQNGGNHTWCVVYLNGKQFVTDLLWDEVSGSDDKSIYAKEAQHVYFNLPYSKYGLTHWNEKAIDTMGANTTIDSYYQRNGCYYKDWNTAQSALPNLIAKNWNAGKKIAEFQFASNSGYQEAVKNLFQNNQMERMIQEANREVKGKKLSTGNYSYSLFDWNNTIVVRLIAQ